MNKETKGRILSLDLLRGVAIILMVLAHTISFFYNGDDIILKSIVKGINTVAFTTFLFIFSSVAYLSYFKNDINWKEKRKKLLKRSLLLLGTYYIVAIVGNFKDFDLIKTLLFIDVPGYTEFILTFAIFSFVILIFRNQLKALLTKPFLAFLASVLIFLIGHYLSFLDFQWADPYKILLVGGYEIYRFPIFQYFPIFIMGLLWGLFVDKRPEVKLHRTLSLVFILSIIPLLSLCYLIYQEFCVDLFRRWPPQIGFLLMGLAFIFSLISLLSSNRLERWKSGIKNAFLYLSNHALSIYIYHTLILLIYGLYFDFKSKRGIIIWVIFVAILLVSILLTKFEKVVKKWVEIFTQNTVFTSKR